jgi:hypothetical protein
MSSEATPSYQKYDGASGTYQTLNAADPTNGSSSFSDGAAPPRRGREKWILGAVVVFVIYGIYEAAAMPRVATPEQAISQSIAKSSLVGVQENGKLKLFDDTSKSPLLFLRESFLS